MEPADSVQVAPASQTEAAAREEGRYLYCVADSGEGVRLGPVGIDGHEVYAVPYRDVCAVVHNCLAEPYQSTDQEIVKAWVLAHQRVVDEAWRRWDTVLPLGFDTIVTAKAGMEPEENLKSWLRKDYDGLKRKIEALRGKAEYGVQVFWEPRVIARNLAETSEEISRLEEEIRSKPRGMAYLYRERLENALKKEMEVRADRCFRDFYNRIGKCSEDTHVERTKKGEPERQMIMNLSCLVHRDKSAALGEELGRIDRMEGFSVRFTGPWPPYSFVGA